MPAEIMGMCPCPSPTVLDAYKAADAVLIVRVLSVEKVDAPDAHGPASPQNIRSATLRVERVYKGNVKVTDQLLFAQGTSANCPWLFNDHQVDGEFLFYVKAPQTNLDRWSAPRCGRSKPVSQATEDLLYLDNMKTRRGKTRVSGRYTSSSKPDLVAAQRSLRIVGNDNVYETFTDENGFFEIYDLPPGNYRLEPEIPDGWRIYQLGVRFSSSTAARFSSPKSVQFVLQPKKHVSLNLLFQPDNVVEGRIVGPSGNAIVKTCAYLRRPDELTDETLGSTGRDCTDEDGRFRIESVAPGAYVLVLNPSGTPRSHEPFPRVFYPGTTELEKAVTINVGLGQTVKDVNVRVPVLLETITVEGVVYYSDDRPVSGQSVRFDAVAKPGLDGFVVAETNAEGRFSIRILKGLQGNLETGMAVYPETYQNCPALAAFMKQTGEPSGYFNTQESRIEAAQDISNLVLRLPIPSCQRNP
jgi:hypothetical protein